jgi:CRP/FNR family transcriptional regulator, cyclic AMP receptor protein
LPGFYQLVHTLFTREERARASGLRHFGVVGVDDELLTIERVAVLQRVSIFVDVPGHTLVAVARILDEVRVAAGATFIERGSVEDWLYIVAEGLVRVHVEDQWLSEVGVGAVVGELAVLAPAPRAASVTAVERTLLLRLRRAPFDELLEDRPEIARAVITSLARLLQISADGRAALPVT